MSDFITIAAPAASTGINQVMWSGAIGAGVALFGAFVLALFNAWFQAREKNRERTQSLRKDVYLPFAASVPPVLNLLSVLSSMKKVDSEPMAEFGKCAAQLALVAEPKTAILVSNASTHFSLTFIELFQKAQPAITAAGDARRIKKYRVAAGKKAAIVQTKLDEHRQGNWVDDDVYAALVRDSKFQNDLEQKYWTEENAFLTSHALHTMTYLRSLIVVLPDLIRIHAEVGIALRGDMDIKTDVKLFLKTSVDQCTRMVSVMNEVISGLEEQLLEDEDSEQDVDFRHVPIVPVIFHGYDQDFTFTHPA